MTANELLNLLKEFSRDKLALRQRHVAVARLISDYEFNNAYQYVIAREDVHVRWLLDAITGMGATPDEVPEPDVQLSGKGAEARVAIMADDRDRAQAFVDTWRPRIASLPNARHRSMLLVVVGETLEHRRFFDQAVAGRSDLLGRRPEGSGTGGGVLPVRWMEQ